MTTPGFADVLLDNPSRQLDRPFTYGIPPALAGQVGIGSVVVVPFINSFQVGYVLALRDQAGMDGVKEISRLVDEPPVFNPETVELCAWMAERYLTPLSQVFRLVTPPGRARTLVEEVRLLRGGEEGRGLLHPRAQRACRVLEALEEAGGCLPLKSLKSRTGDGDLSSTLRKMEGLGLVERVVHLSRPKVDAVSVMVVRLEGPGREWLAVRRLDGGAAGGEGPHAAAAPRPGGPRGTGRAGAPGRTGRGELHRLSQPALHGPAGARLHRPGGEAARPLQPHDLRPPARRGPQPGPGRRVRRDPRLPGRRLAPVLPAARHHRQRQDRGLPALHPRRAGTGQDRHRAGAGDIPHPPDGGEVQGHAGRHGGGAPLRPGPGGAIRPVARYPRRHSPRGHRGAFRSLRPPAGPRPHRHRRGARDHLQGERGPPLPRPGGGRLPRPPQLGGAGAGKRHSPAGDGLPRPAGGTGQPGPPPAHRRPPPPPHRGGGHARGQPAGHCAPSSAPAWSTRWSTSTTRASRPSSSSTGAGSRPFSSATSAATSSAASSAR